MISFYRGDIINAPAQTAMLHRIIANDRVADGANSKRANTAR